MTMAHLKRVQLRLIVQHEAVVVLALVEALRAIAPNGLQCTTETKFRRRSEHLVEWTVRVLMVVVVLQEEDDVIAFLVPNDGIVVVLDPESIGMVTSAYIFQSDDFRFGIRLGLYLIEALDFLSTFAVNSDVLYSVSLTDVRRDPIERDVTVADDQRYPRGVPLLLEFLIGQI